MPGNDSKAKPSEFATTTTFCDRTCACFPSVQDMYLFPESFGMPMPSRMPDLAGASHVFLQFRGHKSKAALKHGLC